MYIHERGKGAKEQCQMKQWCAQAKGRFGAKDMVQRCGIVGFEPIAKMLALWFSL
jgi:hypothetical protein